MSLFLAAACFVPGAQSGSLPHDPIEDPGFQHFYNLEYDEALATFTAASARDPESPDVFNHIALTILYRQMYRSGSLDSDMFAANSFLRRPKLPLSADDNRLFTDAINRAIALSDKRLKASPSDPAALYSMGVSYGVRANYNFIVKKAWLDALSDTAAARKLHTRTIELEPNLVDARMILGVHEYVVACLPWGWRMLSSVAGFSADREQAIKTLRTVAEKGRANRYDAEAVLAAVYRREKRPSEAIPLIEDLMGRFPRAYLLRLELADMYGDLGKKTQALSAVDQAEEMKRSNAPGYQHLTEAKIHYTRGNLLFGFNDLDRALEELKASTASAGDLDPTARGYAWLRLGQVYDLKGLRPEALASYRQAVRTAPDSDGANESKNYLSSKYKR